MVVGHRFTRIGRTDDGDDVDDEQDGDCCDEFQHVRLDLPVLTVDVFNNGY